MKVLLPILFCAILAELCCAQDYYIVTAENGLNVRAEANLSSEKMGKIRFGVMVEKVVDTDEILTINDNGQTIKGKFVQIVYQNCYPTGEGNLEGFVFDGYLKKMKHEDVVTITKIEKEVYTDLLKKATTKIYKPQKVSNLDTIKNILKGRVEWFSSANKEAEKRDDIIKSITTNNGQKISFSINAVDVGFFEGYSAYYPEYDILFLEGGHASDACFSIATGEIERTIGNPEYIIPSPKNTYRLNGYFEGHECISYFFQKKENEKFTYLTSFDWDYGVCTFNEFYWMNENEFIYNIRMNYEEGTEEYFKGEIKNTLE